MATNLKKKLVTAREQIREAYSNGATLKEIAELHSVSIGTVRNLLIEMGAPMRNRGRRRPDAQPPKIQAVKQGDESVTLSVSDTFEGGSF